MLVEAVLSGISDEKIIDEHVVIPSALRDLIRNYNKHALTDPTLVVITEETTGSQLKTAIRKLTPEVQLLLLSAYNTAAKPVVLTEDPKLLEERRIRVVLTRIMVILIGILLCILLGAGIAIATFTGVLQNFLSTQLVTTAAEIIKFIFSPSKAP